MSGISTKSCAICVVFGSILTVLFLIFRCYSTLKDSKSVYFLMEACLGGDLWTVLHDCGGELEEEQVRVYLMTHFQSIYHKVWVKGRILHYKQGAIGNQTM